MTEHRLTDPELQSLRNLGNEFEMAADEIVRLRAELAQPDTVRVPREPTRAMLEAGHQQIDWSRSDVNTNTMDHPSQTEVWIDGKVVAHAGSTCEEDLRDAWAAMIAAAPKE